MTRPLTFLLRKRTALEAGPRPLSYIWGGPDAEHSQLWVTCPNGCCVHGEFSAGAGIPAVWRYATTSEVAEHADRIMAAAHVRRQMEDDQAAPGYLS